jgi:hypothetical protein
MPANDYDIVCTKKWTEQIGTKELSDIKKNWTNKPDSVRKKTGQN